MAIPNIVGTVTGGRNGTGSFTVTPPAGASGYLAIVEHKQGSITPPSGWTLVGSSTGQATWSLQKIYSAGASPGTSWSATITGSPGGVSLTMVGYDGAITVEQQNSTGGLTCPSVTTTNPALVVRMMGTQPFSGAPTVGYPAGATLGRASFAQNDGGEYWASGVAHTSQSTPGASGTAAFTISGSGGHDGPFGWTLAITSSGGGPTNHDADTATSVTATATAAATKATTGGTSSSVTASVTSAATRGVTGAASPLSASATTTAVGVRGTAGTASQNVTATLSADATVGSSNTADAPLTVTAGLTAAVMQNQPVTGQRAVTATTTADAVITSGAIAQAPLNATANLTAAAARATTATTGISVTAAITATAQVSTAHTAQALLNVNVITASEVYEPVFYFTPPTERNQGTDDYFWGRYQTKYGVSVFWNGTTFVDRANPLWEEMDPLEDGVTYFLGGHYYQVTEEVADALVLAGYSVQETPFE